MKSFIGYQVPNPGKARPHLGRPIQSYSLLEKRELLPRRLQWQPIAPSLEYRTPLQEVLSIESTDANKFQHSEYLA